MSHLLFTGFRRTYRSLFCVWCLFLLTGCITAAQLSRNSADKVKTHPNQIQLQSIDLKVNKETIELLIKGDGKMRYSAVKQDFPLGVMVYLHDVIIADNLTQPSVLGVTGISSLSASYVDSTTKQNVVIKILLSENFNYQAQEDGSLLTITFYKGIAQSNNGNGIKYSSSEKATFEETDLFQESQAHIKNAPDKTDISSATASPTSLKPLQAGEKNSDSLPTSSYGKRSVVTAINFHSGDEGESSIVINTSNPIRYDMQRDEANNELRLSLYNTDIPQHHQRQLVTTYFNSAVDKIVPIGRSGNESASKIHIVMREKVPYHILQEQNSLTLFMEPSSIKPMKLEDPLPLVVDGTSTTVLTSNPPPSVLPQPPAASAQQFDSKSQKMVSAESDDSEPEDLEAADNQSETEEMSISEDEQVDDFFDDNPVYTGEEISLDFYETDIKNVFRILQTVSGENFAVDKDVTGTVTLTLEKPAPWDEILNLILKMNGLGKIKEGSIVRIATIQTIKKEQEEKAELFAARAQAREQKKQQEPMFTEYIPINYANADADIKPHIEKLLTPSKGGTSGQGGTNSGGATISVDKRTNMIILTDTKKKIEEAKELIYTLDKVTPQILISARIVEVTKDFSHALGVEWGLTDGTNSPSIYRNDLGGIYGFDIAMNHPVTSPSSIGYTFARLAGTPLLLDARLTASETTNDLKVISSPKILTLDNKEATIKQGVEYPYEKAATEAGGNPTTEFKNIDLSLKVKPQVTPDNRIGMAITIEKNEIAGVTAKGEPFISTSSANTELLVNDGNTIVIGGIVKSTVSETKSGFPILSNIPYLGHLFRSDTSTDNKSELLIFITPTIVQLDQIRQ